MARFRQLWWVLAGSVVAGSAAAEPAPEHVHGQPIIVYVNKDGGRIVRGTDNPRDHEDEAGTVAARSDLVSDDVVLAPLAIPEAQWDVTMACIRERVAPFQILVVDENPGDVSHQEIFVGGEPTMFGAHFAAGVSPAALDCSVFVDGIAFVFGDSFWFRPFEQGDPWSTEALCEAVLHEAGHMWGLDHVLEGG